MRNIKQGEIMQAAARKKMLPMWFPFTGPSKPVVLFVILDGQQQSPANWSLVLVSGAHELQLHDVRLCEYPWLTARLNRWALMWDTQSLMANAEYGTHATWRTWRWVVFCYSLRSSDSKLTPLYNAGILEESYMNFIEINSFSQEKHTGNEISRIEKRP